MKTSISFTILWLLAVMISVGFADVQTEWVNLHGTITLYGLPAPMGTVVDAYDPDGVHCGEFEVHTAGIYGSVAVYRDDALTPEVDEGCDPGDVITLRINGYQAESDVIVIWTENGDLIEANLSAIDVDPGDVKVTIQDYEGAKPGAYCEVDIVLENNSPDFELGAFSLLVTYDPYVLTLMEAYAGSLFLDCEWEYFVYRMFPSGGLRMDGLGDMNNGAHHPTCFFEGASGTIATIKFYAASDAPSGQYTPIQFYWDDCGDNLWSDVTGNSIFISRHVYDWLNHDPIHEDDDFPTYKGSPDTCVSSGGIRMVDYQSGSVRFAVGRAVFEPDPAYIYYKFAYSPMHASVFVGDFIGAYSAENATSAEVNGVAATIVTVLDSFPGFEGEVVELDIPIASFLEGYGIPFDTTTNDFTVTGAYDDGETWIADGEVDLIGKSSVNPKEWIVPNDEIVLPGDVDLSGGVDIDDVVTLILFIFAGGHISGPLMSADCNCSHSIDIDDAVYVIAYIFSGGPPPGDANVDGLPDCLP